MKVFLSSTGRDLNTYHEAAFKAIQGLGNDRDLIQAEWLLGWAEWLLGWAVIQERLTEAEANLSEALTIGYRCEYRLVQADVHNFLAQLSLDANDRKSARRHAEIAHERAWCDGPPHCYKPALDEADALLAKISQ